MLCVPALPGKNSRCVSVSLVERSWSAQPTRGGLHGEAREAALRGRGDQPHGDGVTASSCPGAPAPEGGSSPTTAPPCLISAPPVRQPTPRPSWPPGTGSPDRQARSFPASRVLRAVRSRLGPPTRISASFSTSWLSQRCARRVSPSFASARGSGSRRRSSDGSRTSCPARR